MIIRLVLSIVAIFALISVVYRRRIIRVEDKHKPWYYNHRVLLGLLGVTIIPLIVLTTFVPYREYVTYEEKVKIGVKYNDDELYFRGLWGLAQHDYMNIEKQFDYIRCAANVDLHGRDARYKEALSLYGKSDLHYKQIPGSSKKVGDNTYI
jgi:hypothetical protein